MDAMDRQQILQVYINGNAPGIWKVILVDGFCKVQCEYCHSILALKYDSRDPDQPRTGNCNDHYTHNNRCNALREAMAVPDGGGVAPEPVDRYAK